MQKEFGTQGLGGRGTPNQEWSSDAELAEHILTQQLTQWRKDTCTRYLQVAERMTPANIQQIMMRCEFHFRRDTLVDNISIPRASAATAPTIEELTYLLETLFCKMRTTFKHRASKGRDVVHVMRGVLLRLAFCRYCRQAFPK